LWKTCGNPYIGGLPDLLARIHADSAEAKAHNRGRSGLPEDPRAYKHGKSPGWRGRSPAEAVVLVEK
jgi:hypothetical protein